MDTSGLTAILALIQKALQLGGDLVPIALRAWAALRADHTDEELIALARASNDLDEQKILDLIARADTA